MCPKTTTLFDAIFALASLKKSGKAIAPHVIADETDELGRLMLVIVSLAPDESLQTIANTLTLQAINENFFARRSFTLRLRAFVHQSPHERSAIREAFGNH